VAVFLLGPGPAPAGPDGLAAALVKLQVRYETTDTMRARFRQTVESPTLGGELTAAGTVLFGRPNKMRWTYDEPDPQVIVGDGSDLWIYQPDLRQVIRTSLSNAFQSRTPLTFLAGLGDIERDFDAALENENDTSWDLRLVSKNDAALGVLGLVVRKTDAAILEARITDPVGTMTRLRFTDEERNVEIDPGEFRFKVPDGVDVVRPPTY
jgi:chaperone LolA